jgi:hypothetical protein
VLWAWILAKPPLSAAGPFVGLSFIMVRSPTGLPRASAFDTGLKIEEVRIPGARFPLQSAFVRLRQPRYARIATWYWISSACRRLQSRPAFVFALLSLAFGSAISVVVPPLRGPDEIAHFLRIYSYSHGQLLPTEEVGGRKGIFIEPDLYDQLFFFKNAGERFARNRDDGLRYGIIMKGVPRTGGAIQDPGQAAKFMAFAGTEGYTPIVYAPYILAAALGNLFGLDFPSMLLVMRFFGLITFTAIAAYAVTVTPALKWAFVLVAMLPASIYNRSVLSADGAALACALVVTALCLSAVQRYGRVWERSLWMTCCALSKQPQIVFALLELMACRSAGPARRWRNLALVLAPGLILSPLWVLSVSADVAAWRLLEAETVPREQFDPLWKLAYMWEHPLHFPLAAWTALSVWGDRLWVELIGILGWQDILLPGWIYLVLTLALLIVPLEKLDLKGAERARLVLITGLTALSYIVMVYLIFYVTYTPIEIDHVRGVQGRYFVIVLPSVAIFIAAISSIGLPRSVLAMTAITGSFLSGVSSFKVLLDAHWLL